MFGQCSKAKAQTTAGKKQLNYFSGGWKGAGKFANGKDITAELSFTFGLDSNYLVGHHRDHLPNKFQADTYWRWDEKSRKLSSVLLDNTGAERIFIGEVITVDSLVFSRSFEVPGKGTVSEQFSYRILDHSRFRMEYRVRVADKPWRMIDYLIFQRRI
jgi:hypothetical protein